MNGGEDQNRFTQLLVVLWNNFRLSIRVYLGTRHLLWVRGCLCFGWIPGSFFSPPRIRHLIVYHAYFFLILAGLSMKKRSKFFFSEVACHLFSLY